MQLSTSHRGPAKKKPETCWDQDMATKENGGDGDNGRFADSDALFESIFRAELDTLRRKKTKTAEDLVTAERRPIRKERPFYHAAPEEKRKPERKEQKDKHQIAPENAASGKEIEKPSNRKKLWLLLGVMIILAVVFVNYRSAKDLTFLISIWGPKEKPLVQRSVPPRPAERTDKKQAPEHVPAETVRDEAPAKEEQAAVVSVPSSPEVLPTEDSGETPALQYESRNSYPYSIYLGSYKALDGGKKAVSVYEQKGLSPYWVRVDLGAKGVWYRVFAGYFQTREEAEAYIRKNELPAAATRHTAYANLIGVYKSGEESEKKRRLLGGCGYDPYVIEGADGVSFLCTGAFYQKRRAEKAQKDLAAKGIHSQVVSR
jgi:hypothetical protein